MKQLKDLNLMDRFLFDNVMEDADTCRDILSVCLGVDIPKIQETQPEKELGISPGLRAVRLDVFSFDEENTVYNAEMQNRDTRNLPRRSRLYQAHMDVSLLPPGEFDFNKLNDSYMVMIMPFDLFGKGRYRYTFQNRCEEDEDIALGDGAIKIYLNTEGKNDKEVSPELIKFLKLVKNSDMYIEDLTENKRLLRIQNKIREVKENEERGVRYMTAWEEKMYERLDGREEGRAEAMEEARIERERLLKEAEEAREEAIRLLILDGVEYGIPIKKIVAKLMERYKVSESEAVSYIERYREH